MKSESRRRSNQIQVREFWDGFRSVAAGLEQNPTNQTLVRELDRRVRRLRPDLSWEIGPGLSKAWQFVVSPNLNRDLQETARSIVALAPVLSSWEFYSARQPKKWDYKFRLGNERLPMDASGWTFVLLEYPDGAHEVLLKGKPLPPMTKDERWQAAAITL